jgi:hypothetical protein
VRTWVIGIIIGACVLTSSCREGTTIPGKGTEPSAVKIQPKEGLLKPWDFTYDCVTNEKLGLGELNRCREQFELAESDKEVNKP